MWGIYLLNTHPISFYLRLIDTSSNTSWFLIVGFCVVAPLIVIFWYYKNDPDDPNQNQPPCFDLNLLISLEELLNTLCDYAHFNHLPFREFQLCAELFREICAHPDVCPFVKPYAINSEAAHNIAQDILREYDRVATEVSPDLQRLHALCRLLRKNTDTSTNLKIL